MAKQGSYQHFLLHASKPIAGTKRGFGHAILGGFAISAVKFLIEAQGFSSRKARITIAKMLADAGCSLKSGDHEKPKPITDSAIRGWIENPDSYPLQHKISEGMMEYHFGNLKRRNADSLDNVLEYFRFQAQEIFEQSKST